jgi:hypothetical protein
MAYDHYDKILILGSFAFAATGSVDYRRDMTTIDPANGWNLFDDANTAFTLHGNDVTQVADEWASRAVAHYSELYRVHPERVAAAAKANNVLVFGLFFIWKDGTPQIITRGIIFAPLQLVPVTSGSGVIPIEEKEISTDSVTMDLIDGKTEGAKAAAGRWEAAKKNLKPQESTEPELAWRHLQFLIQETSSLDSGVSPESDILEIPVDGKPKWIVEPDSAKAGTGKP